MRKILVAIPYLHSGGVEVSLIRFLNELVKDKNNQIDLLMLKKKGMYLSDIPKSIKIKEIKYSNPIYDYDHTINDLKNFKGWNLIKFFFYRLKLKHCLRHNNWEKYYKEILKHVNNVSEEYDLAIDWHGYGHFITSVLATKVNAHKKAMWIHDEKNQWLDKVWSWINEFDKIYCVGLAVKENLISNFPSLKMKTDIFYNIINYEEIRKKSLKECEIEFDKNKLNIITVGRLEWQKGYDITLKIAELLRKDQMNFKWYIVGTGSLKNELQQLKSELNLDDFVEFLGVVDNPFPYVKNANLYVLSSRHEGYCLATLEAKILGKIIVATDIPSNREQIENNKNGILCPLDPKQFFQKIKEVSSNEKLKQTICNNLKTENFDFSYQLKKIYKLMEKEL